MNNINSLNDIEFDWQYNTVLKTSAHTEKKVTYDDLMVLVSNILLQFGIPVHNRGYVYLREAIIIKVNNQNVGISITKILYPSIAKKFDTSTSGVERAIRHSIEVAWNRMDKSYWKKKPVYPFSLFNQKPKNSEFVAMIVDHIMLSYNLK